MRSPIKSPNKARNGKGTTIGNQEDEEYEYYSEEDYGEEDNK